MDLSLALSPDRLMELQRNVESFNKVLNSQRPVKQVLDKNDFLQILITQLTHQDPTQPMEDRDFVAQMAQFSTLEQMMNMGEEISQVTELINRSQAYSLLGKTVTVTAGNEQVTGKVDQVSGGDLPQLLVNGKYYDFKSVDTVSSDQGASK